MLKKHIISMAEEIKEVPSEPVVEQGAASVEDTGGINSLDDLFNEVLGPEDPDEGDDASILDDTEGKAPEKEKPEPVEAAEAPNEERVQELLAKNKKGEELTKEELEELKAAGYEEEAPEASTEEPSEEEPKEKAVEWKAPAYVDRLKAFFPEGNFESQEGFDEGIQSALDNLENYVNQDKMLTEMIEKNPEVGTFLKELVNGSSVMKAMMEAGLDPNDVVPKPGEEGYEDYVYEKRQRNERASAKEKNLQKSTQDVKEFFEKNVTDPKMREQIGVELTRHFNDITNGKITGDLINLVHKGLTKDADVEKAKREGKVEGLNEKIVVKKKTFKRVGDGISRPSAQSNSIIKKQKVEYANDGSKELYNMMGIK